MTSIKFLVTGTNGFIGGHLVTELKTRGFGVKKIVRQHTAGRAYSDGFIAVGSIGPETKWNDLLEDIDVVVHLAARVHILKENSNDPLREFRDTNVLGTERLARHAAASGVRRFIYLSTIGVNGSQTSTGAFTESDEPHPHDPYSVSKQESEEVLHAIAAETGLEVVILRLPLVYGPRNPGNFLRLLELISSGWPLPLRSVNNRRSLLFVGNLMDAIIQCATFSRKLGGMYLICDDVEVSIPELIERLGQEMGQRVQLFPFPVSLLRIAGRLFGRSVDVDRLLGSLVVDSSKIRRELEWYPPYTLTQGLHETIAWYKLL